MQSSDSPAQSNSGDACGSAEGLLGLRGEEGLSETGREWTDSPGLSGFWGPHSTAEGALRCVGETSRMTLGCGGEISRMRTEEELMNDYTGIYSTLSAIQVREWNSVYF